MKGKPQFRRRFSLQPSFLKEESDDDRPSTPRAQKSQDSLEPLNKKEASTSNSVRVKIVVMGPERVGKTSVINQFLYGTFSPKYKRTVEEMHQGEFNVGGVQLTLDILDTSGANDFPAMRALSISSGDAFILVYDVTDRPTFDQCRLLRDEILLAKNGSAVPIVVVGNKTDLVGERQTEAAVTETIVTVDWENGWVEASAKANLNVSKVFKELLAQAKVKYNLSPALRRRRRQSLPLQAGSAPSTPSSHPAIPSSVQLLHLQQIRDKHGKRNSCIIS